jgi:hypothetical protein
MKLLAKIGLLSLLAGATATVVYGDPQGGWLSPNGLNNTSGNSSANPSSPVDLRGQLSLAEVHARILLVHEQTRADARHIQHLQQVARQAKDVIKLNCVNDKLVQVKPMLNLLDEQALDVEVAGEGERGVVVERITGAAEGIHRLREEADQCIGEPVTIGSESSNSFSGPTVPDDPTKGFAGKTIEPPGYASPFN